MNYKHLIILLVIIFLISMMYKELLSLKNNITASLESYITNLTYTTLESNNKLNNNVIKYISQIKEIGNDNLQQLRKITMLNHQPITKISNHFTETDNSEIQSEIHFLSDNNMRYNNKPSDINNCRKQNEYYMSDNSTIITSGIDGCSTNNSIPVYDKYDNGKYHNDKYHNDKYHNEKYMDDIDDIPIYVNNVDNVTNANNVNNVNNVNNTNNVDDLNDMDNLNDLNDLNNHNNGKNDIPSINFLNKPSNINEFEIDAYNILQCNDTSCIMNNNKTQKATESEKVNESENEDELKNESDIGQIVNIISNDLEILEVLGDDNNEDNEDNENNESYDRGNSDGNGNDNGNENDDNDNGDNNECDNDNDGENDNGDDSENDNGDGDNDNGDEDNNRNIQNNTIKNTSNKKPILKINTVTIKNDEIDQNKSTYSRHSRISIVTGDNHIKPNNNKLTKITDYSVVELKEICKKLGIPITYVKKDGKRKLYTKEELYKNIAKKDTIKN
jgi:hypothetical protein